MNGLPFVYWFFCSDGRNMDRIEKVTDRNQKVMDRNPNVTDRLATFK